MCPHTESSRLDVGCMERNRLASVRHHVCLLFQRRDGVRHVYFNISGCVLVSASQCPLLVVRLPLACPYWLAVHSRNPTAAAPFQFRRSSVSTVRRIFKYINIEFHCLWRKRGYTVTETVRPPEYAPRDFALWRMIIIVPRIAVFVLLSDNV